MVELNQSQLNIVFFILFGRMGNTTQKQQKRINVYVSYTVTKNLGVFPAKAQSTAGKKCYTVL